MLPQPVEHGIKNLGLFQLVVDLVIQAIPYFKGDFITGFLGEFMAGLGRGDRVSRAMHKQ